MDGAGKGTNATSISDPTPDNISIGCRLRGSSGASFFLAGRSAEMYILDTNMSDAEHGRVGGYGISPLWNVPITNVRAWYPLQADDNNRMAGGYPNLTATGSPTFATHPANVIYPRIGGLITF